MNGTQPAASTTVGNINFAGGWRYTDTGDFNGDGKSDLMFQNTFTHDVAVWQMDGSHLAAASVAGNINTAGGWQYTGVGDFNGDGKSDLLFVNSSTHDVAAWTMNGGQIESAAVLGNINTAGGWRFTDVGDFNSDGKTDLLFINDNTHGVALWQTDGKQVLAAAQVGTIDAGWHFADVGDFNSDGKSDLLLLNDTTHGVAVWQMNGTSASSAQPIGFANAADTYAGLQDFNGDHKSDVLFQNTTTGAITAWEMNGTQIASIHKVGTINVAADYHLVT
jgi:hypothetical protein